MNSKKEGVFDPTTVQQLANALVIKWLSERGVELRPGDRSDLIDRLTYAIPAFLSANHSSALADYITRIRSEERQTCIDIICDLIEPVPGLINKQRAINACANQAHPAG